MIDETGPLASYYLPQMISYFKNESLPNSTESRDPDKETRRLLHAETKPHYEILSVSIRPSRGFEN